MVLVQACAYTSYTNWSQFHWLVPRRFLFLFPSYECQALWLPTSNGSGIAGRPTNMRQQGKVVPSMVITTHTCTHSRAQNQPLLPIAQAQVSEHVWTTNIRTEILPTVSVSSCPMMDGLSLSTCAPWRSAAAFAAQTCQLRQLQGSSAIQKSGKATATTCPAQVEEL